MYSLAGTMPGCTITICCTKPGRADGDEPGPGMAYITPCGTTPSNHTSLVGSRVTAVGVRNLNSSCHGTVPFLVNYWQKEVHSLHVQKKQQVGPAGHALLLTHRWHHARHESLLHHGCILCWWHHGHHAWSHLSHHGTRYHHLGGGQHRYGCSEQERVSVRVGTSQA